MTETCDLAVIGLGALGSSTAWHAASRGLRVVGIEAFEFGHDRGASHDTSRIIRHSYHTPAYVALTFGAYDDWARLEEETGEQFVTVTGGLDLYPRRRRDPAWTTTRRRWTPTASPTTCWTSTRSANGGLRSTYRTGTVAIHQARTGIVPAAKGTAAMAQRAQDLGAVLHYDTRVESIRPGADGADVVDRRRRDQRGTGGGHSRRVDQRSARRRSASTCR